ncbi:proline dehydrogenase 1, mitochondrial-like isoform X2 [Varroa destructor]|nr:proline dehydrogenase 1, mitochondrial-like isoform X2 [Varroa destructor]XP_022661827.1 proline dehydrogenase 1, mitochondrial-like isoform X2 [Varroa destructor]
MVLGQKILGKSLFRIVMRKTFYGHFVGGESEEAIKPMVERLKSFGVKSILDYSAEEDLSKEKATNLEMASLTSAAGYYSSGSSSPLRAPVSVLQDTPNSEGSPLGGKLAQFQPQQKFADRRSHHVTARTYFYLNEAQCEKNTTIFLKSVDAVAGTGGTGLAAIKLTALGRPQLLMQLSEVIVYTRKLFRKLTGKAKTMVLEEVSPQQIEQQLRIDKDQEEYRKWLDRMDYDKKGLMNIFSWSGLVDTNCMISDLFKVPNLQTGKMEPIFSALTKEEEEMFRNMMRRVHTITEHAQAAGVRVMVDAEQTYFQPAISRLTVELMRKYNKEKPIVFNTYQCYLKEAFEYVQRDIELSKRQNFCFSAKIVRGAYMEQERLRAVTVGYEDPINESYEATNEMYHKVLDLILSEIVASKKNGKISVMCATHNENTIRYAVQRMKELGIGRGERLVCFGQLLGMCDQVSFPLGQAGYSVYKYVPYGPIDEVMPYLSRRAVENNSLLKKVSKELDMLSHEIRRRILKGQWFYRPRGEIVL